MIDLTSQKLVASNLANSNLPTGTQSEMGRLMRQQQALNNQQSQNQNHNQNPNHNQNSYNEQDHIKFILVEFPTILIRWNFFLVDF